MTELQILNAVSNSSGTIAFTDLMNIGLSDTECRPNADKQLIRNMIDADVLSGHTGADQVIHFGPRGELRLRQLQQEAEDQAKHERQQRFDNKIAVANILVPLVTFVLGLLAEHYAGILSWILSFF